MPLSLTRSLIVAAVAGSLAMFSVAAPAWAAGAEKPSLVPWPAKVELKDGTMPVTATTRVMAGSAELLPLAKILADELQAATKLSISAAVGAGKAGDVTLAIDKQLKGEAYGLAVTDHAAVRGGNYAAVALGTVTFLQSVKGSDAAFTAPQMVIADQPHSSYRGLMLDVARQYHTLDNLRQVIEMCRLYKIRYLHLHLTDDQSFMFPSTAFPKLSTVNQTGGATYTLAELKDLVAFADARDVTLVPELEVPGHAAAMNRAMTDLFKIKGTVPYEHHASINFAKPEVMKAVNTLVGEMCAVFKSSPYFHIGGDEADLQFAMQNDYFKAAAKKESLPDQHELYRLFLTEMNDIVKKNKKQTIVWEGFHSGGKVPIPKDIIVMSYEIRFFMPPDLLKDGYTVINASWTPLYILKNVRPEPKDIYAWKLTQFKPFGAKPTDEGTIVQDNKLLIGGSMCSWEQKQEDEVSSLRTRIPAMSERLWNPSAAGGFEDYDARSGANDKLLDLLLAGTK